MSSIRPATPTDPTAQGARHAKVKDLTFLLGPPGDPGTNEQMTQLAARVRISPEELWIETVRGIVCDLLEAGGDGRSVLDRMFSEAVGEPVTVWDVTEALHLQAGCQVPGIVVPAGRVLDAAGNPVEHDLGDRGLWRFVGNALMEYSQADWAVCIAFYEPDELGFPSLAGGTTH
jgi:hypothetical protein